MDREPAEVLARLAEKYRLLTKLRERREAVQRQGQAAFDFDEARARRAVFKQLAREFPGALRELEAHPLAELRARHRAVLALSSRALDGPSPELPRWLALTLTYHRAVGEALRIKRWLALHAPHPHPIDTELLDRLHQSLEPAPHALSLERLALHHRPPGGRLQNVVWAQLEARFGQPRGALEPLIFGDPIPDPSP